MVLKTLDKALEVLKHFEKKSTWGVRELAQEMNSSPTVVYRIISTFEKHKFLRKNDLREYKLGLKFLDYCALLEDYKSLENLIQPYLEDLAEVTRETSFFTYLDGDEGITLALVESPQPVKFGDRIGVRVPLNAGASNLVILAYIESEARKEIINKLLVKFKENTIENPMELEKYVNKVRGQGWCITNSHFSQGVIGISVPIFDHRQRILGSLSVAGLDFRLDNQSIDEILALLLLKKKELQEKINKMGMPT